jgi:hypothetical protein
METIQDRLTLLPRTNRTVRFCDACLALKMGAFPREVLEAVAVIRDRQGFQVTPGVFRMPTRAGGHSRSCCLSCLPPSGHAGGRIEKRSRLNAGWTPTH